MVETRFQKGNNVQDDNISENESSFQNQINSLQEIVGLQNKIIQALQLQISSKNTKENNRTSAVKSPMIQVFKGNANDRTSERVNSFFYSITTCGKFYDYEDEKMVSLAECHLQYRAAIWITRLEKENKKPKTLDELKREMLKEFVPSNEKAAARVKLMEIKSSKSENFEEFLTTFDDLICLCETPTNEAYIYFFNSLPINFKGKFAKKFPDYHPVDTTGRSSINVAYEYARTLDLSLNIISENSANKNNAKEKVDSKRTERKNKFRREWKDPNALSWGPAKKGEFKLYKNQDRCFTCGEKGWSESNHPCRKEKATEERTNSKN